jgi:hypothetical protein
MAQHQTNTLGPHGPVYTENLANYEKVSLITFNEDILLKLLGQLRSSTTTFGLPDLQ